MCRSIKVLRRAAQPTTDEEITAAALQFVRKVSGFPKPSKANKEAFDQAVAEIASATNRLLQSITSGNPASIPSDNPAGNTISHTPTP